MNLSVKVWYAVLVIGSVGLLVIGPGCGKPKSQAKDTSDAAETTSPTPEADPVDALSAQIDELFWSGKTNEVVVRMDQALADPVFKPHRQRVFGVLVRFLLSVERLEEAQQRMLEACAKDIELAKGGFGLVYGHLNERGQHDAVLAWTEQVLAIPKLPAEMQRHLLEWTLGAHLALQHDAPAAELAGRILKAVPGADGTAIVERAIENAFAGGRLAAVEALLTVVADETPPRAESRDLVTVTRIRLQAAQGQWDTLADAFQAAAATLPDARLQSLLRTVAASATKAGKLALVDTLSESVVFKQGDRPQSVSVASRLWIETGMAADPTTLPTRLDALLRAKVPARQVCGLYTRYYYDVINKAPVLAAMMELGERLAPLADEDETRNLIRTMLLDGSFVREDYTTAIRLLEGGIPGRDAQWHAMALSKVRAHKAIQDEKPRDAVKYFREFMVNLAGAKDEDTVDPESGIRHTKEMILGRNAKRIGDILAAIPDAEAAKQAYAESRDYYGKALEKTKDEPEARKVLEKEMALVP